MTVATGNPPHRWEKGKSGNPAGRPKAMLDLKAECRAMLPEILAAIRTALGEPENRMRAVNTALAYGFGRPVSRVDVRVIRSASDLTDEELAALESEGAAAGIALELTDEEVQGLVEEETL